MHLRNLGRLNLSVPPAPIDEDREELRAKGKEIFSGRAIHWDKLGIINRARAYVSSDYAKKVHEEFKRYIQKELIQEIKKTIQPYTHNNLATLKQEVRKIKDLTGSDVKELLSTITKKENHIASKFFSIEKEKLVEDLIERECLSLAQFNEFISKHPDYKNIKSLEEYTTFKNTLYNKFNVPLGERS